MRLALRSGSPVETRCRESSIRLRGGGGAIPLEARRLGLEAYGGDLNPVAVLVSKGLVEIPPRFEGLPPVNPKARPRLGVGSWERAQGLAEDVSYYGRWMRDLAFEQIGHLYPKVTLPTAEGGGEAAVIAWLWARTVQSPDPSWDGHVPLVRSWVVRKATKNKPMVWVEPVVDRASQMVTYRIREGGVPTEGTVGRRGGTCVATASPVSFDYIRQQGREGLMGRTPMAVIAEGTRSRVYVPPLNVTQSSVPEPSWKPASPLPRNSRDFKTPLYGIVEWADLFTDRQLVALSTFSDLLAAVFAAVECDARAAGMNNDGIRLRDGGSGVAAYADAVLTYLAFAIDKCADYWSTICSWHNGRDTVRNTFARQAIPMVWDYAEANPFSDSSGNWLGQVKWVTKALATAPGEGKGYVVQRDALARIGEIPFPVVCTDPPYYDNISYADLSDFFYVWLRRNLSDVWPEETATLLTPKAEELIANPYRAGSKQAAKEHFEGGIAEVLDHVAASQHPEYPATIFYAYKQQETRDGGTISTGWETFLQGLVDAGLQITATWPIRTELSNRPIARGAAALASSVVIACRPRQPMAPLATRREFLDALHAELPGAVRLLKEQAIPPVDIAQSVIGPGVAVFSRHAAVLEADGESMSVRTALALINETLEGILSEEETEFDRDTRWAITWYEQNGHNPAPFGDAETLSKAKNTSVTGVADAGIAELRMGKVRLLTRSELDPEWDPLLDPRRTVWELTQHLIARLDNSETDAGDLLRTAGGGFGDRARQLAYLLFDIANRHGRSNDAVAYNSLIQAWHDIAHYAAQTSGPPEPTLGI